MNPNAKSLNVTIGDVAYALYSVGDTPLSNRAKQRTLNKFSVRCYTHVEEPLKKP